MSSFEIKFEWEDAPRSRAPELKATWARLEILVNGEPVTRVEDRRRSVVRTGIYVPLFPIAEWIVSNWFFLWDEWRDNAPQRRHNLRAAREGFALPDLSLHPTESKVEITWKRFDAPYARLEFLADGSCIVDKEQVRDAFFDFVEAIIQQLRTLNQPSPAVTGLLRDWKTLAEVLSDPQQLLFCERTSRLGYDPFNIDDAVGGQIENLGRALPPTILDEFCDAVSLEQISGATTAIRRFIDGTTAGENPDSGWGDLRSDLVTTASDTPWQDGYRLASRFRAHIGLNGTPPGDIDELLGKKLKLVELRDFKPPGGIEGISVAGGKPVIGIRDASFEATRRFLAARCLGDLVALEQTSLVTRGSSEHQQRNRAFAAEFLAPADAIRKRLSSCEIVNEEDIEELAREFQVSSYVIRHQIQNHELVAIAS